MLTPNVDRDRVIGLVNTTLAARKLMHDPDELEVIEDLLAAS